MGYLETCGDGDGWDGWIGGGCMEYSTYIGWEREKGLDRGLGAFGSVLCDDFFFNMAQGCSCWWRRCPLAMPVKLYKEYFKISTTCKYLKLLLSWMRRGCWALDVA